MRMEYWRIEFADYTVDIRPDGEQTFARIDDRAWVKCNAAQVRSTASSKKSLEKLLYEEYES